MPPARGLSSRTHRRPLWVADMSLPPCVVAEASAEAPHSGCIFRGLRTCSQAAWGTSDPTALKAQRLFEWPCGALTTRSPEAPPQGASPFSWGDTELPAATQPDAKAPAKRLRTGQGQPPRAGGFWGETPIESNLEEN